MILRIASPKEFWAGLIYLVFGCCAILLARSYELGTAIRMGPAYFPTVLGWMLSCIGLVAIVRSFKLKGAALEAIALRPLFITIGATLLFAMTVRGLGLALALPLYIMLTAAASPRFRPLPTLILAALMSIFCCLVFVKGLNVPLPILGPWLSLGIGESGP